MRIFTRYILGEVLSHALLGGVLFTFILFMPRYLGPILELLVNNSASLKDILFIILDTLPLTLKLTIPIAVLVGILLGLSRLASDSEVTAMRACGVGVLSFVRVVALVAAAGWGLGLFNSMYLTPHASASLLQLTDSLKGSIYSQVQPRVFYTDFPNHVLYVQDVHPAAGVAVWRNVFLADLTDPRTPHIWTSATAFASNGSDQTIRLHLNSASEHDISPNDPKEYHISTFATTDLPIETGTQAGTHIGPSNTSILAMSMRELWRASRGPNSLAYRIELNSRLSYPVACFVLMLVGVPLGLSSKRGGKSTGFILTILLVFLYYILSLVGTTLANQQKIPVVLGVWGANILFTIAGVLLLQQMSSGGIALSVFSSIGIALNKIGRRLLHREGTPDPAPALAGAVQRMHRGHRSRFPLLLDGYVMRSFLRNFVLVLTSFAALFLLFTFFELIGDIIRNQTPLITVGEYLVNLIPFILYHVTAFCALVAVLVTFSSLDRSSELTAMKATGISLYRIVTPVLLVAAVLAAALFAFDESYLPAANRRQEELRSIIKGKPAQTFLLPDRKWISGQAGASGEPARIFYYQFFDQEKTIFANLTVFEFQPDTFVLQRRIFALSARWDDQTNGWVFENGWQRNFSNNSRICGDAHEMAPCITSYHTFTQSTFPEIHEQPGYFKQEDLQSQEMSYGELTQYIRDLQQSGFDTLRLRVQLNLKLAYPAITFIMAVLAIPFALSMGKRGGMAGMATAIGLAIAYMIIASLFESLGDINSLPPMLAAWSPDLLFGLAGSYLLLRTPT